MRGDILVEGVWLKGMEMGENEGKEGSKVSELDTNT